MTVRENYEAAKIPREQWGYPEFPLMLAYLWDIFVALCATRSAGMQANAITYTEMLSYSTLHNITLTQFDISAIQQLDAIALTDPSKLKEKAK